MKVWGSKNICILSKYIKEYHNLRAIPHLLHIYCLIMMSHYDADDFCGVHWRGDVKSDEFVNFYSQIREKNRNPHLTEYFLKLGCCSDWVNLSWGSTYLLFFKISFISIICWDRDNLELLHLWINDHLSNSNPRVFQSHIFKCLSSL